MDRCLVRWKGNQADGVMGVKAERRRQWSVG